jgi:hypothetical protein
VKLDGTLNAKGELMVRRSEQYLNTNVTVISEGIKTGNRGSFFVNYTSPVQYQYSFNCIGGDIASYLVCYTCSECSAYGRQDVGSKFESVYLLMMN